MGLTEMSIQYFIRQNTYIISTPENLLLTNSAALCSTCVIVCRNFIVVFPLAPYVRTNPP